MVHFCCYLQFTSEIDGINLTEQYQFDKDGVILTLEWDKTDSTYSYRVDVVPNLSLNFSTSSRVHIKALYNSPHNVSVMVSSCGKYSMIIFFKEVFYCELKISDNSMLTEVNL